MIMDYYSDGTLLNHYEVERTAEPVAYGWFAHLCSALGFVHARGFAHRDIKMDNVLLDRQRRIRLAEFGLLRVPVKRPRSCPVRSTISLHLRHPEVHVAGIAGQRPVPRAVGRRVSHRRAALLLGHRVVPVSVSGLLHQTLERRLRTGKFQPCTQRPRDYMQRLTAATADLALGGRRPFAQ
jgi:serine/threonine protein kinase